MIQQLSVETLRNWIKEKRSFTLVDVREDFEHAEFNLGGILIPLSELMQRFSEIPTGKPIVFYCRKGIRSVIAIQKIAERFPEGTDIYNVTGGTEAWKQLPAEE
jgi:rhodanese-related sulfurtransferase